MAASDDHNLIRNACALLAFAKHGSYEAAARALTANLPDGEPPVTDQAVRGRIQAFEDYLGMGRLIAANPDNSGSALTPLGREMVQHAREIVRAVQDARAAAQAFTLRRVRRGLPGRTRAPGPAV